MERGYIRTWRKIVDCEVLHERGKRYSKFEAWIYLCLQARGTDDPVSGLKRGELRASYRYLAKAWLWSVDSAFRFIRNLEREKMITRAERLSEHFTEHLIICNYELYNPGPNTNPNTLPNESNKALKKVKDNPLPPTGGNGHPGQLLEIYNAHNRVLPQVKAFSEDRKRKCRSRINRAVSDGRLEQYLLDFARAVDISQVTPFLNGSQRTNGHESWRADFGWLISNDSNIYKILEGKYGPLPQDKPKPMVAQHITQADGSIVTVLSASS